MNPILRNILAFIGAVLLGSILNMLIVNFSSMLIPPPAGADLSTEEGLKAAMPLMEPKHFLMPFLAHALGTLLAGFLVSLWATSKQIIFAMAIAALFFIGGVMMIMMLPSPMWFNATDLILAYFPMAWLGYKLSGKG